MKTAVWVTRVLACAVCALPGLAFGDMAPLIGVGGCVRLASADKNIRMVSERVEAVAVTGEVRCDFVFRNEGPARVVKMGFPEGDYGEAYDSEPSTFDSYAVWADGKRLKARRRQDRTAIDPEVYVAWWVSNVSFKKGQTRHVRVHYTASSNVVDGEGGSFFYMMQTGSGWKGPIGDAIVVVDMKGVSRKSKPSVEPSGWSKKGRRYIWHWKNLKPTAKHNIKIEWGQGA